MSSTQQHKTSAHKAAEPAEVGGRFVVLDSWRGICALLVAVLHFRTAWTFQGVSFVRHFYLFVDFFFLLSGFVITHAYFGKIKQTRDVFILSVRRFGRLWPLHVTVLGAFVAIELFRFLVLGRIITLSNPPFTGMFTPYSALLNIPLIHALGLYNHANWNGPSWSISVEFWTNVVFAIVALASKRLFVLICAFLAGGGAFVVAYFAPTEGLGVTLSLGLARCFFGFFSGCLLYFIKPLGGGGSPSEAAVLALLLAFLTFVEPHTTYFAIPIFGLLIIIFGQEKGFFSRLLKAPQMVSLGRYSYSIYMLHSLLILLIAQLVRVLEKANGTVILTGDGVDGGDVWNFGSSAACNLSLLIYLIVLVWSASLTFRYIEEPARHWFNGAARRFGR